MAEEFYKEISIDSINPDLFPDVAVYLKSGANFMLYKPHGRKLTSEDLERLHRRSGSIYIRTGDMEVVSVYQEQYLAELLGRKDLKSPVKGKIFFQICADYVAEISEYPQRASDVERCRHLIQQIAKCATVDKEALAKGVKAITAENPYQTFHGVQVAALTVYAYSRLFPAEPAETLEDVSMGALHIDLGMTLGSPVNTKSSDSLSQHEYQLMKQHATMGYDFLKGTGVFSEITLAVVHHHHERVDGKGYPGRLHGTAIPLGVQVAALCDSFCAMTSDRSYRKAVTTTEALQSMKGAKGAHDPVLFHNFEKIIRELPW